MIVKLIKNLCMKHHLDIDRTLQKCQKILVSERKIYNRDIVPD